MLTVTPALNLISYLPSINLSVMDLFTLKNKPLLLQFLAESVQLPTLAQHILQQPGGAAALGFKGFFLGNPWTDPTSNAVGRVQALYGHGLVPKPAYDAFAAACKPI